MHFSPAQVDDMSLWQFAACVNGWAKANGAETPAKPPSNEEHDALLAKFADV